MTVRLVVSWIFAVVFGLIGLITIFNSFVMGALFIVAALILLPPANAFAKQKWNFALSGPLKFVIVLILVVAAPIIGAIKPTAEILKQIDENTQAANSVTPPATTPPAQPVAKPTTPPPAPKPAPAPKSYQQVFIFSGSGAKTSEPFTITGDRFKVKYECTGSSCTALAYKVGSASYDYEIIMNGVSSVKDETIIYGKGEYYIESRSIGTYTMIVEDYR